ncbi:hypothetical protein GW17_00007628 [Ensete ventricosum]|nr:hypothetical protein GW17_00007628 [Ensete ventricosum]
MRSQPGLASSAPQEKNTATGEKQPRGSRRTLRPTNRISRSRRSSGRGWASGSKRSTDMPHHHAYIRLGSGGAGGGGTPSPPASPRRSPRIQRRGGKAGGAKGAAMGLPRAIVQRMSWMLLSLFLRRQAIFLFTPLLYVASMIFYMGTVSLENVPHIISRSAPGSVYRSPRLYERLRSDMDADNSSDGVSS